MENDDDDFGLTLPLRGSKSTTKERFDQLLGRKIGVKDRLKACYSAVRRKPPATNMINT
jgi:hypothetical protein